MLRVDGIAHTFAGPDGTYDGKNTVVALAPITFQVRDGEFVVIVGPSGGGKSTLLHIIAGLLTPTEGEVLLDGIPIREPQRRVGMVFQQSNLMPWRTVLDNLALPLELAGIDRQARQTQATQTLDRIGLTGFEHAYPSELSGGMAQRVAIGRALIYNPEVLLLDEPFGALDALTREQMQLELLKLWAADHKTALMVTHSISEAVFVADRVLVMSARPGRIRAEIPILLPRPRTLDMVHAADFGVLARAVRENIDLV